MHICVCTCKRNHTCSQGTTQLAFWRQGLSLACSSSIRPGWLARVPRIHLSLASPYWDYKKEPQAQPYLLGFRRPNSCLHALLSSSLLAEPCLKLQAQACQRHHFSRSWSTSLWLPVASLLGWDTYDAVNVLTALKPHPSHKLCLHQGSALIVLWVISPPSDCQSVQCLNLHHSASLMAPGSFHGTFRTHI